ncbi:hypothetical protein Tco_1398729 [Tanacetum coccineum]
MELCTTLQSRVLTLETTKTNQALEINSLKRRVKKLETKKKSRTHVLKRLRKVGSARRVEFSDEASLEVTLIDETQGRNDEDLMFDTSVLDEQEVKVKKTLIEIRSAKPKAKGTVFKKTSTTTTTIITLQPSQTTSQDKGIAKMIEPKMPLKKKDQIMYDQEVALKLLVQLQAKLEEEERIARQKEKEANIALIE